MGYRNSCFYHREYEHHQSNMDIREKRHRYHSFSTFPAPSTAEPSSGLASNTTNFPGLASNVRPSSQLRLPRRQLLQIRQRSIEDIAVTTIGIRITVLPNRLKRPPTRNRTRSSGTISRQHERRLRVKSVAIPSTGDPPIIRGIDHRPPARLAMIRVHEIRDPVHHAGFGETVTCPALGSGAVLHVEHTGEGSAVA